MVDLSGAPSQARMFTENPTLLLVVLMVVFSDHCHVVPVLLLFLLLNLYVRILQVLLGWLSAAIEAVRGERV
jgi:hypothetical protein